VSRRRRVLGVVHLLIPVSRFHFAVDIKQLKFLNALAHEQHFGRAAEQCFVSQPTLSARIRQLEQELGILIVERGAHSYHGLTAEGQRVLHWAQRILADCDSMRQDVSAMQEELAGAMSLGVVPSALPFAPLLTVPFHQRHPRVSLRVLSQSSQEIQRNLDGFDIEAGVTYIDNEPLQNVRRLPLYQERYAVLTASEAFEDRDTIGWIEAASLALCLLTPDMQNRRIIDNVFAQLNCQPTPEIETNSIVNLYAHVRMGKLSTIVPANFAAVIGDQGVRTIPLREPEIAHTIGLVVADRDPVSPLVGAILDVAEDIDLSVFDAPLWQPKQVSG